jgi:DNA polymerase-3 subunit beta
MKFTINTNDFKSAVKRLAIVAIKGTLPTASAIQFEYDGREMMMTTNNLQQQRTIKINVVSDRDKPCKFTIDCIRMNKLLTCIRNANIVIEYDGFDKCKVDIGTKITFDVVHDCYKFDDISTNDAASVIFYNSALKDALNKVSWAVANKKENRKVLTGVAMYVDVENKMITSVATNGKYLAVYKTLTPKINIMKDTKNCAVIIPHEALNMIDSLDDVFTVVSMTDTYMLMVCGDDVLTTKLIAGDFPNWKQVVPEKTRYKYKTDTKHLIKEIKQVQKIVKTMEADADIIQFTLNDCNVGMLPLKHNYNTRSDETVGIEHTAKMEYTTTELMPETFIFKFKFDTILPILESFDSDVKFGINNERSPFVFNGDANYKVIAMPCVYYN